MPSGAEGHPAAPTVAAPMRSGSVRPERLRSLPPLAGGLALLALLLGVLLRIAWNDVSPYSRADEQVYVNQTRFLVQNGWASYPRLVQGYLADSEAWLYPSPARWGYLAVTTAVSRAAGRCEPRTLAWVSTGAGVAVLVLVFLVGLEMSPPLGACLALLFAATSPLQLALGRRALSDEVSCAAVLLTLWAALRSLESADTRTARGFGILAIVAATLGIAIKESFLLFGPAFVLLLVVHRRGRPSLPSLAALLVPPAAYLAVFAWLAGGLQPARKVIAATSLPGILGNEYARLYQAGPPHRVLLDQFILSPGCFLLAVAALTVLVVRRRDDDVAALALGVFLVASVVVFGLGPSKNVRYTAAVDPLLRLLSAWVLTVPASGGVGTRVPGGVLAAVAAAIGLFDLSVFHVVFVSHAVYDPVTENLLRALQVIPGG